MHRILILAAVLVGIGACSKAHASPSPECSAAMEARITKWNAARTAWYSTHGGKPPGNQHRTVFVRGTTETAVLVLHGFYSSPYAMRDLIEVLKAPGHTVLAPLITGFGAGYEAANDSRIEDWQAAARENIETLRMCFPKVAIVAHCLGGALVLDQAINGSSAPDISKMVLVAPYVRTYFPGLNVLNDMVKAHLPYVDLRLLRLLLGLAPENILPISLLPTNDDGGDDGGDSKFPLQAVESALDFQKRFQFSGATTPKLAIPVTAMVSDSDQVIDGAFALDYLKSRFENVTSIRYDASTGVSHYMHTRARNPRFEDLAETLSKIGN